MMRFAVTVMAGRYDADERLVAGAFLRETARPEKPLIFTTEQGDRARTAALTHPGYGLARCAMEGRRAEQVVLFPEDEWEPVGKAYSIELENGKGGHNSQRLPIYATIQLLRHKITGHLTATIAVHMPSHLDKASPFYWPINLILWRRALATLAHHVAVLRRLHPGIVVLIGGDWNARQLAGWTAKALQRSLPGFRAGRGDLFGNVWMVGCHEAGPVVTVQPQGSSDHTIKRFVLEWNTPRGVAA